MGKITAAHLLVRTLKRHGVNRIFGLCVELGRLRYDRVIEGMGGHGEHVEQPAEFRPALERALKAGKAACVNVMIRGVISPLTEANIARAKQG